jgi:peroxiredoxin
MVNRGPPLDILRLEDAYLMHWAAQQLSPLDDAHSGSDRAYSSHCLVPEGRHHEGEPAAANGRGPDVGDSALGYQVLHRLREELGGWQEMDSSNSRGNENGAYSHVPPQGASNKKASALPAGAEAPDFTLYSTPDQAVSLSEFRGQPVILAFYPADWSPVCSDQMALYNEILPEFQRYGAQLLGISVDGKWCHNAFSDARKLRFPLLADFEPKGEVARSYGVYRDQEGVSERALFVVDGDGIIRWSHVSPVGVNPGADGILQALESLTAGDQDAATAPEEVFRR